jgi:hypothetical protein
MATRQRLVAPALAVLLLGACTLGSAPQTAPSSPAAPSARPSGSPTATSPSGPSPSGAKGSGVPSAPASSRGSPSVPSTSSRLLQVTTTARIPLAGQTYARGLVLFGRYAAWVGCAGCQRTFTDPAIVYVADLTTGRVRAAATAPANSFVGPLGGNGSRLVYLVGLTGDRRLQWAIDLLDVPAGTRSTLAKATQRIGVDPPVATVGAGQVVWQTFGQGPQGASHGPVNDVDLRTGARRTVTRDLPGVLGAVTGRGLVYRSPTAPGTSVDQGLVDAFVLRGGGRPPLALSTRHDVQDIVADDRTAAWQTNQGPGAGVWAGPLDGHGPAREYYHGGSGDRAVGDGFLAVVTAGDAPVLLVYPLAGGPVVAVGDVPGEFDSIAAEGSRLAYIALPPDRGVQPDAKHPVTLVVATVRLPGS